MSTTTAEGVRVDAEALRDGVQTRLGDAASGWAVDVEATGPDGPQSLEVRLRSPQGRESRLVVDVLGTDPTARAVEVAAAAALAIEDAQANAEVAEPEVDDASATPTDGLPEPAALRGWVGADAQLAVNADADLGAAGGTSLRGGMWLLDDHVQPMLAVSWDHGREGALRVHAFSAEACGLVGGWVGDRTWLGAGGCVAARHALALDRERASRWGVVVGVPARLQVRVHRRVVLGAEVGLQLSAPPLRFIGADDVLRWQRLRLMAGLGVAVVLGDTRWTAR